MYGVVLRTNSNLEGWHLRFNRAIGRHTQISMNLCQNSLESRVYGSAISSNECRIFKSSFQECKIQASQRKYKKSYFIFYLGTELCG